MDVLWKGAVGGLLTALIVMASKKGDVLPGILPLIPIFAIIALLAVGSKGDPLSFRTACLAIGKTLPAYVVFLVACYLLIGRLEYRLTILGGMGAWLLVAGVIFWAPRWDTADRPIGHRESTSR
jgi:uncharacterized membrane protein (GlpM family)